MSTGQKVLGVVLFALAGAILYVWGLKKSLNQQEDLNRQLISVCGSRVVKYLKRHDSITKQEIAKLIQGVSTGQFWSRHKVKVQDGSKVSGQVIAFLLEQQYIEAVNQGSYRLKK